MTSLKTLSSRLNRSPAACRAGTGWLVLYRAWKAWALRRPDGAAHFRQVKAFTADVVGGYYDVRNSW